MHDVDPTDWDRWCEYILYKGLKRVGYARVSRSTITDTELQVGKFVVPRAGDESSAAWALDQETRNRRVDEGRCPRAGASPPCSGARASGTTGTMSLTSRGISTTKPVVEREREREWGNGGNGWSRNLAAAGAAPGIFC